MPISFLQPALTLALVTTQGWEKWNASYWDSLLVSAPLLIFSRAAVCGHTSLSAEWTGTQPLECWPASSSRPSRTFRSGHGLQ